MHIMDRFLCALIIKKNLIALKTWLCHLLTPVTLDKLPNFSVALVLYP